MFPAIYWYGYEYVKANSKDPGVSTYFIAGATSGAVCDLKQILYMLGFRKVLSN